MIYYKTPTDTIYKPKFDGKIYKTNGTLLVLDTDFELETIPDKSGTASGSVIDFSGSHSFQQGDNVLVLESDGIARENIVVNVGTNKLELKKKILGEGSCTVSLQGYKITLKGIENGLYTFSDHSSIIVSETFVNIVIDFATLSVRYKNFANYKLDLDTLNRAALDSVIADFSNNLQFFRLVDTAQLNELLILKIGTFIETDADALRYTNAYNSFKKTVSMNLESDNGTTNGDEDFDNSTSLEYSWGARS